MLKHTLFSVLLLCSLIAPSLAQSPEKAATVGEERTVHGKYEGKDVTFTQRAWLMFADGEPYPVAVIVHSMCPGQVPRCAVKGSEADAISLLIVEEDPTDKPALLLVIDAELKLNVPSIGSQHTLQPNGVVAEHMYPLHPALYLAQKSISFALNGHTYTLSKVQVEALLKHLN